MCGSKPQSQLKLQQTARERFLLPPTTDLLGDDTEHLQLDTVELVEASPGPWRGEPLEELAHGQVIESVGAVEDDALCTWFG